MFPLEVYINSFHEGDLGISRTKSYVLYRLHVFTFPNSKQESNDNLTYFKHVHSFCTLCSDKVGHDLSTTRRYVVVDDTRVSFKSILLALFRLLGRYYEHQRSDRDLYVNIYQQNIKRGKKLS